MPPPEGVMVEPAHHTLATPSFWTVCNDYTQEEYPLSSFFSPSPFPVFQKETPLLFFNGLMEKIVRTGDARDKTDET